MKVAEIYKSIQGEGLLTGVTSVFVRTSGCNLRCWFCDTPWASWEPEGRDYSVDDILAGIEEWDASHAVLTGGEPMLFAELIPLTERLRGRRVHVTVETAGTLYLPVHCDLMSISPKLASSGPGNAAGPGWRRRHERDRLRVDVLDRLIAEYDYQLKFVVDRATELDEIEELLDSLATYEPERVLLMPQSQTLEESKQRAVWLKPHCFDRGYTYCPRRQLEWFGSARGT